MPTRKVPAPPFQPRASYPQLQFNGPALTPPTRGAPSIIARYVTLVDTPDTSQEKKAVGRFYLRDTIVPFCSDETHELRPVQNMKMASSNTLFEIVCSFLNTWKPCTMYYGITEAGLVRGVMLNQKERDVVRLGIDKMERTLRPRPMPQSIAVEFVPILRTPDDSREAVSVFVVEVIVRGAPDTLYIPSSNGCYLRDKATYHATTEEVRA
ncbi:hypothetical protein HPB51_022752 [Rhipicephalus microplus]|uniref:Schlafen AlbA-2 domain-containing protein n=1 Tax=Rhipicephalus microplus TaxID=6941 RepID=A0A9J6EIN1_RHIMP|nr:hypothetical protein HPB51_022752 [Rhipicephalus microplus]